MQRGQAFDAFKLLIAAVVAGAILVVLLNILGGVGQFMPSDFDASKAEFSDVGAYPIESTLGTIFTIKSTIRIPTAGGAGYKCARPHRVAAIVGGQEVGMYDDGKHGDRKKGDCVFGGEWDSLHSEEGVHSASIMVSDSTGVEKSSKPLSLTISGNMCVTLREGDAKHLDIVFLGSGYDDLAVFDSDVDIHMNYLLSTAPFSEYLDIINVHRVRAKTDFQCTVDDGYVLCDDSEVDRFAAQCPCDEVIVLVNTDEMAGTANPHAYCPRLYPEITVHEFGHSFGPKPINLADQYSLDVSVNDPCIVMFKLELGDPANCDVEGCPKWAGLPNIGCVHKDKFGLEGCTFSEWYHPVKFDKGAGVSIMEGASMRKRSTPSPPKPVGFDIVCQEYIKSVLEEYK